MVNDPRPLARSSTSAEGSGEVSSAALATQRKGLGKPAMWGKSGTIRGTDMTIPSDGAQPIRPPLRQTENLSAMTLEDLADWMANTTPNTPAWAAGQTEFMLRQ